MLKRFSASSAGSARRWCSRRSAIRFLKPEWNQYALLRGVGRPGLRAALHGRPVARRRQRSTRAAGASYGTHVDRQHRSCSSASWSRSTTSATRQNKRWDLTANQVYSLSDQTIKMLQELDAPVQVHRLRPGRPTSTASATGSTSTRTSSTQGHGRVHRPRPRAGARQGGARSQTLRHDRDRVQGPHRARDQHRTSRTSPTRLIKVDHRRSSARSTSRRATARRTRPAPSAPATARIAQALEQRQLRRREAGAGADRRRCPPTRRSSSSPGRAPTSSRPRSTRSKTYLAKGGKVLVMLDPPEKADAPPLAEPRRRCSTTGASRSATTSSSTPAAWARCSAPTRRCRWPPTIRRTRSPSASS